MPGTGYRAIRRIGAGSSSEIYEVVGPDGMRRAAKVLRSIFADTLDAVLRIEQEGRALATLVHPSLVRVLDTGTTFSGRPYFVMPLLDGETVRDRLQRGGPMAPAAACAVLVHALEGLDIAHQAGIVHRDIKPANLFLQRRSVHASKPRCVVLDFGIAKLVNAREGSTTASRVMGTPRYLSPEQILGGRVDARTDVYAAGLSLFEMITGRSPFDVTGSLAHMRAHVESFPRKLRDVVPVSPELEHVVGRAIERSPERRWPSARAFAAVLARAAEGMRMAEAGKRAGEQ